MNLIQKSIVYLVLVAFAFAGSTAMAQQVTGELGSPSATTTIDGKQLPAPDPKFGGVIKERCTAVETLVGTAHRAAQGGTQRPAHHHR